MSTRVLTVAKALARPWMEPGERAELTWMGSDMKPARA